MKSPPPKQRLLVAITGASGAIYAERLVEECLKMLPRIYLLATEPGREVMRYELKKKVNFSLLQAFDGKNDNPVHGEILRIARIDDFFSPLASGSSGPTHMVVLPCSSGSLARMANGLSTNLIERAADVILKEKKKLIVCPRETPLNRMAMENMLKLHDAGAVILPLMPAFYHRPQQLTEVIDFMVAKIMDCLGFDHNLLPKWNARSI